PASEGEIRINGAPVTIRSPADAMRMGMALLTEDRKATGCFLPLSILENMQIAALQNGHATMGYVDERSLMSLCGEMKTA
ncbi:D-xylose ABC transporter ATP-binding protein, partial [Achromobacter sp. SIMBA_011]